MQTLLKFSRNHQHQIHSIAMILVLLLASGCAATATQATIAAGEIIPISTESTLWIMRGAINGGGNTLLLGNGQNAYLFARYLGGEGWGFVTLNYQGQLTPQFFNMATGGNGNLVGSSDMKSLLNALSQHGWKAIPASGIPEVLRMSILESALWQLSNFTTFAVFAVPVSLEDVGIYTSPPEMVQ